MKQIIINYLLEKKECPLPGIGHILIEHHSASYDVVNKLIHPPTERISFSDSAIINTDGLVKYIAAIKNTDTGSASSLLNILSMEWRSVISKGGSIVLNGIGTLNANNEGSIVFNPYLISVLEAIPADPVIHKNSTHEVRVGDRNTTSAVMTSYYKEKVGKKKTMWPILAAAMAIVSIGAAIYHFSDHSFSSHGIGNHTSFNIKEEPVTHIAH